MLLPLLAKSIRADAAAGSEGFSGAVNSPGVYARDSGSA